MTQLHLRVVREVLRDGLRVLVVALHPQRQRLDALQEQERVERRERRAGVAQQHGARASDVRRRPEGVGPDDAVVGRVGLREAGEAVGLCVQSKLPLSTIAPPSEVPWPPMYFVSECTAMSAPSSKTRAADRRRHRVVDDQRQAGGVRRVCPGLDVDDVQAGIADRLGEHEPRLVVDVPLELLGPVRIDEAHLDAVLRQRVREQVVGAAVERRDRDDVLARARDVQHRVGDRCLARTQ